MILVIDNYDSFTFNLVQYLYELEAEVTVYRNDKITVEQIQELKPQGILISPGPGTPDDAGVSLSLIDKFKEYIPIFGVCLGHQSIAQYFGGKIVQADKLMHGKTSKIHHQGQGVFKSLPSPFTATRYHSLIAEAQSFPSCLVKTAHTEEGEIMGLKHKDLPVEGVQFHPESFLTEHGHTLLKNWLDTL